MKKISIIGSTGSIGENTLKVLRAHPGRFKVVALAAKSRADQILRQAIEFRPKTVCIYEEQHYEWLSKRLKPYKIKVVTGDEGLIEVSTHPEAQQVIFALVGAVGLKPIFAAVGANKNIAVANKEPLVMAGELLMSEVKKRKLELLPIDSEHSGIWQCLEGRDRKTISRLVLTSSGGPFLNRTAQFNSIHPEEALKHPKWKMGPKITIDSATLMNKGLEVIEASNLFDISVDRIDVVVHPQAAIHALIEFVDGSYLAQIGITDMRLPIQYALSYPGRLVNSIPRFDLVKVGRMNFQAPDKKRFPCLELGYEAKRAGGSMPAVLNAANEVAVQNFLNQKISFVEIPKIIAKTMRQHRVLRNPKLTDILQADFWARETAEVLC